MKKVIESARLALSTVAFLGILGSLGAWENGGIGLGQALAQAAAFLAMGAASVPKKYWKEKGQ